MLRPILAAIALSACASAPDPAPPSPNGRLYHYVRSNQDGSLPEQIYLYRASDTHLEVGKIVSRCNNAAFVTADLDLDRRAGLRFVGGRIAQDGSQAPFAFLNYDPQSRSLHTQVEQFGVDERLTVSGAPYILYDFDLSDLNAVLASTGPTREDFRFAVVLIWPVEGATNVLSDLGWAHMRFVSDETRLDREALRFDASGALNGQVWLDAREGHILEARFAEPNHTEYTDFSLVLQSVEDNAEASWRDVRTGHWRDCP